MRRILFRFIYIYCICTSIAYCNETREEIDKRADNKLDDSLGHAVVGAAGVGYGIYEPSRGNPIGAAVSVGAGVHELKNSVKDFNEARSLKEKARSMNGNK